jgi:hypothetical protein
MVGHCSILSRVGASTIPGAVHGRAEQVQLGLRHVRLAAGAAVLLATTMIDTLEDTRAPRRAVEQAHEAFEERAR